MIHSNAVVWVGRREARVIEFDNERSTIRHFRHPANDYETANLYNTLIRTLGGVKSILVMGPGQAKGEFTQFAKDHMPAMVDKLVGVEESSQPHDFQILDQARAFFKKNCRWFVK